MVFTLTLSLLFWKCQWRNGSNCFHMFFLNSEGHTFRTFDSVFQSSRKYRWQYKCWNSVCFGMILLCLTSKARFVSRVHLPNHCFSLKRDSLFNLVVVFKFNGTSSLMHERGLAWDPEAGGHTTEYICDWKWLANKGHSSKTKQAWLLPQWKKNREKEAQCSVSCRCSCWAVLATAGCTLLWQRNGGCDGAGCVNRSQPRAWATCPHCGTWLHLLVL